MQPSAAWTDQARLIVAESSLRSQASAFQQVIEQLGHLANGELTTSHLKCVPV